MPMLFSNPPSAGMPLPGEMADRPSSLLWGAFFRRLFKPFTGLTAGQYRRMFRPISDAGLAHA
jgi:hypothetical protein